MPVILRDSSVANPTVSTDASDVKSHTYMDREIGENHMQCKFSEITSTHNIFKRVKPGPQQGFRNMKLPLNFS